ncbi:hypothetical protein ACFPTO_13430 [Paraburkholderia denitrificans]|uniref:Uncharacterized protein n=1 Tax=Paraburkholderia denitrificans TaxID=694025 RepID=A0ABW0J9M3_9BURK
MISSRWPSTLPDSFRTFAGFLPDFYRIIGVEQRKRQIRESAWNARGARHRPAARAVHKRVNALCLLQESASTSYSDSPRVFGRSAFARRSIRARIFAAQGSHSRLLTNTLHTTRRIAQNARPLKFDSSGSPQKCIRSNAHSDAHALLYMPAIFALFCARCIDNPICEKEHLKSPENGNDVIRDFCIAPLHMIRTPIFSGSGRGPM